jgi:hypothetical protein
MKVHKQFSFRWEGLRPDIDIDIFYPTSSANSPSCKVPPRAHILQDTLPSAIGPEYRYTPGRHIPIDEQLFKHQWQHQRIPAWHGHAEKPRREEELVNGTRATMSCQRSCAGENLDSAIS